MNIGEIIGWVVLWHILGLICFTLSLAKIKWVDAVDSMAVVNPIVVHKYNKQVNWFGAIVLALVFTALCPLPAAGYWFYKLCTVGRK
jgi:hypothetical protein